MSAATAPRPPIQVSLVIPLRNEARSIETLLSSIHAQTRSPDEVIFVDGGSTDDGVERLQRAIGSREDIRILEVGPASPGRGRNLGAAQAKFQWLAFTDGGIELHPRWLEHLVAPVEADPSVSVVYGNYEPTRTTFIQECAELAYVAPKADRPSGRARGPSIASSLIRRSVWQDVGGFPDLRAAEDLMFLEEIQRRGYSIAWAPEATVYWQTPATLGATFRRFELYSKVNVDAGRVRDWHYGIARKYLLALPFILAAVWHTPLWLAIPLLAHGLRALRSIWVRRKEAGVQTVFNPLRVLGVAMILWVVDLATFAGWFRASWLRLVPGRG